MISRAGKSNFLKDHYEWLALGVGILALLGAVLFCLFGGDIETRIDETVGSVSGRSASAATVAALDLAPYDGATNTAKAVELARRLTEKYVSSFASEKRLLCDNESCARAMPEKFDADRNLVCAFCGATQKVSKVAKVLDADEDGLPDLWEKAHGLNPADPADADGDADGDGFTNREEYLAKTDPQNAKDHPDYLDSLALQLPLKRTYMPFLFVSATPVPKSWRCEFFDPNKKDDYGRKGLAMTAVVGEKIGKSGFALKSYEKKSVKRTIKGSVNQREVDVSEAVVERLSDGRLLTLPIAESKKAKPAPIDVQATLAYSRGKDSKTFDVVPGTKFSLNGNSYVIRDVKALGKGAKVIVEDAVTGRQKTLEALEP